MRSGGRNVINHIASRGDHIWTFFRQGAGNVFTMCHTAKRVSSHGFQIFCDVSSGGGVMPLYGI